jgi:hypothetical protein
MVPDEKEKLTVILSQDFPDIPSIDLAVRNSEKFAGCRIGMDHSMVRPHDYHTIRRFFENGVKIMIRAQIFDQCFCFPGCCRENGCGIHGVLATNGI